MTTQENDFLSIGRGSDAESVEGSIALFLKALDETPSSKSPSGLVRNNGNFCPASEKLQARDPNSALGFLARIATLVLSRCEDVTLVLERGHIDASYRDTYYEYYSRKYFDTSRFSIRISLFRGRWNEGSFLEADERRLESCHIGSVVVNPLGVGTVGRTLLNPAYLLDRPTSIRLSEFETTVKGKRIRVAAFPYRKQDGEVLRCAEVSLLNLFCYYSNEFPDYQRVLPGDIIDMEAQYSHQRVVPSAGMTFFSFSKIMLSRGFFPRLYSFEGIGASSIAGQDKANQMRRLVHWYVASGIPVAVNVCDRKRAGRSHSLLCVGHPEFSESEALEYRNLLDGDRLEGKIGMNMLCALEHEYRLRGDVPGKRKAGSCILLDAADFSREFVVIDDGQQPYSIRDYDSLSAFKGLKCMNVLAPLHRGMTMDALDAYDNALAILGHHSLGVIPWSDGFLGRDERIVMEMKLVSSRAFKRFRVKESPARPGGKTLQVLYSRMVMPHFMWIFELYRIEDFLQPLKKRKIFAEIALDATSGNSSDPIDKVVCMRYPGKFLYCQPSDKTSDPTIFLSSKGQVRDGESLFEPYSQNLELIALERVAG